MKLNRKLYIYSFLSQFKLLSKSYIAKIMVVAFLGTHVPLLALLCSFILSNAYPLETAIRILGIALLATLIGTGVTLYALHRLLVPIILTSATLQNYINHKRLPELPTQFTDEAGKLMANTSQTLRQLDELIHYISNYDELTGLPNQELFRSRLQEFLCQPDNNQKLISVVVLSVDDFTSLSHGLAPKKVNSLLRAIAQRLISQIASPNLLAHLKGDEFAIAQLNLLSFEGVLEKIQVLLSTLAKPFHIEGELIRITASIGITINHLDEQAGSDHLVQQARMALCQARKQGHGQYHFYSPEMNAQLQARLTLEKELYGALKRGEMEVYYQPLIDLSTRQVTAVEALVRWHHPTQGLVSPAQFIPIAEANGLIVPIGEWVLRMACAQNVAWQKAGLPPLRMSVNLSARQFEQPNLMATVGQILTETGLSAASLELEVTESFLMADIQNSIETLTKLQGLGVLVALDDFGTGYSSLSYLKRLPVNMLKIDQSFVSDLLSNAESMAITDAIIALAKSLQLHITAEGIKTQAQLDYLQTQGCQEGQGYYFSRPVPVDTITSMLCETYSAAAIAA